MTRQELLSELKDIPPPPEPAWWLFAPGHIALAVLFTLMLLLLWYQRRRRRRRRLLDLARGEFEAIRREYENGQNALQVARDLALWMKRSCLLAYDDRRIAAYSGRRWLQFLDQTLGDRSFTRGQGSAFGDTIYRAEANVDAAQLLELCERWLNTALAPRLLARGVD